MSTDLKTDFYFRHRALIEEWAALREPARTSFDTALRALGSRMASMAGEAEEMPADAQGGWSKVRVSRPMWVHSGWRLSIALGWNTGHLLKLGSNGRPYVGVALDDTTSDQRRRSKAVSPTRRRSWRPR